MQNENCAESLRRQGKAYPRTCAACGLGPCKSANTLSAQQAAAPLPTEKLYADVDRAQALGAIVDIDQATCCSRWLFTGDQIDAFIRSYATPQEVPAPAGAGEAVVFPLTAWQTMDYARKAISAMLTHMGMDEDEWNKTSFEQCRSAVRALEYQLAGPDEVARWKALYHPLRATLVQANECAKDLGFDGVIPALAALAARGAAPQHLEGRGHIADWSLPPNWLSELTDVLSNLAQQDTEIGKRAEGLGQYLPAIRKALAVHPVEPMTPEHAQLAKFYAATNYAALVEKQAYHIEKLQAKLPATPSLAPQRVREG